MKKYLAIMLTVLMTIVMFPISALADAGDIYDDGTFQYTELADGTLSITKYVGGGGAVVIPSAYSGKAVTAIGNIAFSEAHTITSVTIPANITSIGSEAFKYCSKLSSVTLADGLGCIGYRMFYECNSLTSVTIPSSVTSIGSEAFSGCGLTSVTLSDGLANIGHKMFEFCTKLTSVTIPESVKTIGGGAFSHSGLTSITIPNTVTSIGTQAFSSCGSLSSATLSNGLTVIGEKMFEYCYILSSITIPSSITTIGEYAFYLCTGLTSVTLSDGLTIIGSNMFDGSGLTSIIIPASVVTIGFGPFYSCKSLTSITLPENLTVIVDSMFRDCESLVSITLPSSVSKIDYCAFQFCDKLSSVTLSENLSDIALGAFGYCPLLESITIPANVASIGDGVFAESTSFKKIVVLSKTTTFGDLLFYDTDINSDGIYGFAGSTAQDYAETNSIPFHAFLEVTYDSQGGSAVPSGYAINSGDKVDEPDEPTKNGYDFGGWYPTSACNTAAISFPYTVTADTTLYAKWTKQTEPQTGSIGALLSDDSGNPLEGYTMELHSTVKTGITDANGEVTFDIVPYIDHALIIKNSSNSTLATFNLNMKSGATGGYTVDGSNINITFTEDTVAVQLSLSYDGEVVSVEDVTIIDNPDTGDGSGWLVWAAIAALILIAGAAVAVKKRAAV